MTRNNIRTRSLRRRYTRTTAFFYPQISLSSPTRYDPVNGQSKRPTRTIGITGDGVIPTLSNSLLKSTSSLSLLIAVLALSRAKSLPSLEPPLPPVPAPVPSIPALNSAHISSSVTPVVPGPTPGVPRCSPATGGAVGAEEEEELGPIVAGGEGTVDSPRRVLSKSFVLGDGLVGIGLNECPASDAVQAAKCSTDRWTGRQAGRYVVVESSA